MPGLTGSAGPAGVDRATRLREDPHWVAAAWADPTSRALLVDQGRLAMAAADGGLAWLPPAEAPAGQRLFLGRNEEAAFFAVLAPFAGRAGLRPATLREVGAELPGRDVELACHAVALANWHASHPRCPRCGEPTEPVAGGASRRCAGDGSEHFPRTDPAVIMRVEDRAGRVVLGRAAVWEPGRRSVLAGYVEPGESAEQAVVREVAEEVGLTVTPVRYLASQPWPFPMSLMLAFVAAAEGEPRPDGRELVEAERWDRAGLRAAAAAGTVRLPAPVSVARRLLEDWLAG